MLMQILTKANSPKFLFFINKLSQKNRLLLNGDKQCNLLFNNATWCFKRHFCQSVVLLRKKEIHAPSEIKESPVKEEKAKVALFDENDKELGKMSWFAANKIATKKDLRLVQISDSKDKEQVFKLMTGKDLVEQQKRQRAEKKGKQDHKQSKMNIKSTISDHDLKIKISHILDWLQKEHEVKVTVKNASRNNNKALLQVFNAVTEATKDNSKVFHSKHTDEEIIFHLRPVNENTEANHDKTVKNMNE